MTNRTRSRGWWIPWSFVGLFAVMLIANGAMTYYAFDSWTGIETRDSYVKGLAYNDRLAEAEAQAAQGWKTKLDYAAADGQSGRLTFLLTDRDGVALNAAAVSATLVRPTHEGHDFTVELTSRGDGLYSADVAFPLPGQWDVRLDATHRSGIFRARKRILVQP